MATFFAVTGLVGLQTMAQGSFELTDSHTAEIRVFTNSMGTASQSGTLIVFEGQLDSDLNVTSAYNEASGLYLASVQLLTQIKLFDELPASNEVGEVQGAVAALKDAPESSTGDYFVWAVTNGAPVAWVPLNDTNGVQFAVADGTTNYITFVFSYPTNAGAVTYQVFIGDVGASEMTPSASVTSATTVTNGIESVSLLGQGGLIEVGTASGNPGPLSASVDFSVYATDDGIRIEIFTSNENGGGAITVYALINGVWTPVGTIPADEVVGSGSNRYVLYASGLTIGQSYLFKIVDEAGHSHTADLPIEVKAIKMDSVTLTLDTMTVTFNSEYGRRYLVKVSADLKAPMAQWTTEYVSQWTANGWAAFSDQPFMAGPGAQSVIRVPVNKDRAYFRVIMVEE